MGRLEGKVSIVTGAGTGIGRAIATVFAKEGSKVIVADLDLKGAEETVEGIRKQGGEAAAISTNISKAADVEKMVQYAVDKYGKAQCSC